MPHTPHFFAASLAALRRSVLYGEDNHNHRPCRWFAQAPLGPITSRAYRLIEFSFYCMMRPTAIEIAAWRILLFTSLDYLPFLIAPYQLLSRLVPRFARIFFLGIAKAFWNHRHCRWFSLYNEKAQPIFVDCALVFLIIDRSGLYRTVCTVKTRLKSQSRLCRSY